ncbi:unnamed protein product [Candida verbasci]|uniref:Adenylyl cyclase-associated protein n=1 Tax=Candida verbasci TaxID=1227364 RepID=A0A9W4XBC8_9ASCO|nr:unnamed protein product [Candida verbasci]
MSSEDQQFNVQGYNIVTILKRLEAATSRLEDVTVFQEEANKKKSIDGEPKTIENAIATFQSESPKETELPKFINAFEKLISDFVAPFITISNSIDPIVGESAQLLGDAFNEQLKFLKIVALTQKPKMEDPEFQKLLSPLNEILTKISNLKDDSRKSQFFSHLNTLSESTSVFYWIGVPTPVSYISDIKDSAKFWSDRVLKEFKDKDKINIDWVNQISKLFDELKAYVKEYHATGPSWNVKGKTLNDLGGDSIPAPPPPPPPSFFEEKAEVSESKGMNAVFEQLNQGSNITSGLKKVDKSEMTHKNPDLRKQPPKKPLPPKKPTSLSKTQTKKEPKKDLIDGTKWNIQHFSKHDTNGEPMIIDVEMHQSVFIGNCNDVTIQLKGKANAVSILECNKIAFVVGSIVSGIDIIKCIKFDLQIIDLVPIISVDKSDEGQIYLSKQSIEKECQIFTSSTTALNINVPEEQNDYKELNVPEQFVSKVVNGKLVSEMVEHAG